MSLHREIELEKEICGHLGAHGWLYEEGDAARYDRKLALFPADLVAWVKATQPDAWEALAKNHGPLPKRRCSTGRANSLTTAAPWTFCAMASRCWGCASHLPCLSSSPLWP